MENHIRHWRRERGLSQEALGKLVGLGKPTISKLERGDLRLRDITIAKLVDALDVPAHDLLGDYASGMTRAGEAPEIAPSKDTTEAGETDFGFQRVAMADKAGMVAEVFASVAPKYDLMNDLMSMGIHRLWKAEMIAWLKPRGAMRIADVAGGTGDIAFRILERATGAHVSVCDINPAMLAVGRDRALDRGILDGIDWLCGDAESLPLADASLDAVTIAFGIRNVTHLDAALVEARRVLRPGGRFLCLEFSHVALPALAPLYDAYSFKLLPLLGKIVANDRESYQYLVESIRQFPDQETFKAMITDAGLGQCRYRNLSGGVAALHSAWRI
ncbi:MAG: bifunctional demethylmenaquinone methyltransferase/2-methoxy-6-polyprenyl-1,4-benzoquinol methylase UbiE [Alphaproteobacteria bacterium]|jgi:demethylmenaquinone methyltransferase/2-methoxy-6-polyprenyl-1,4-benzoquinol methylase